MLLRDVPEGAVVLDDGLTDAPVSGVDWLDPRGGTVDLRLADGTVRTGPGSVLLRPVDGDRLAPVGGPVPWLPPRWDARAAGAWTAYVAGDLDAARAAVAGVERVEFTGDYDAWTPVESALVLRALLAHHDGDPALVADLGALLDVEARSAHPAIARRVLLRRFAEDLPEDPADRLRESARRWARASVGGIDADTMLAEHRAALDAVRGGR